MRKLKDFHQRIRRWYAAQGRHALPWRRTRDPYAIWVSEIMLQQTQVKTVLEKYYHPFLKRFPTLAALAASPLTDVLKAWEGLGYYTRARNLHAAARQAKTTLPRNVEELIALPGIGRNTAYAIAAFAYHEPVPVMEANVKRVLHRLAASEKLPDEALWEKAHALLDRADPFTHNQAMMDIGALVCTPKRPRCGACPLSTACAGKANPEAYPAKKAAKKTPVRKKTMIVAVNRRGEYFLASRETALLGGLYGFPQCEAGAPVNFLGKTYRLSSLQKLGEVTHTYSHFRLEAEVYLLPVNLSKSAGWFSRAAIARLPLSKADHKALRLAEDRVANSKKSPPASAEQSEPSITPRRVRA